MKPVAAGSLLLFGVMLGTLGLFAQEGELGEDLGISAEDRWVKAYRAFDAGDYDESIELYLGLQESGVETGHLYYNLGNAYLRTGKVGPAIAAYNRAQALLPRDRDVAANLGYARAQAKDDVLPPQASEVLVTLLFWHESLSRRELFLTAALLNGLFWLSLGLSRKYRDTEGWKWVLVALVIPLFALGGSWLWRTLKPDRLAVITARKVEITSSAGVDAKVLFELHEGAEIRVLAERGDHWRITLPDGMQGLVRDDQVEIVER